MQQQPTTWRHLVSWTKVVVILGQLTGATCLMACAWNWALLETKQVTGWMAWTATVTLLVVGSAAMIATLAAAWRAANKAPVEVVERRRALANLSLYAYQDPVAANLLQRLASRMEAEPAQGDAQLLPSHEYLSLMEQSLRQEIAASCLTAGSGQSRS